METMETEVQTDVQVEAPAKTRPVKAPRIPALDFTKGALVLFMVLYHWLNYFVGIGWPYYRYLRFLTPSFIFISGFMISNVYLSKYSAADPRLSKRLFTRGMKLLALFVILNVARAFLVPQSSNNGVIAILLDLNNIVAVYVTGNVFTATGKAVAFYILVPISYLLLLSAGLLFPYRTYKYTFHAVGIFLLTCVSVLELNHMTCPNLELVTIGVLGALFGFVPIEKINNFVKHPGWLAIAYIFYLIAITIWNVPLPLTIAGVCLTLAGLYVLGQGNGEPGMVRRHMILLGKYSLFAYVAQIAILQLLSVAARHVNLDHVFVLVGSFCAAFALTMVTVEAVDRLKARSTIADRLFKVAFA